MLQQSMLFQLELRQLSSSFSLGFSFEKILLKRVAEPDMPARIAATLLKRLPWRRTNCIPCMIYQKAETC